MKTFVFVLIFVLLYTYCYFIYPHHISIIQTNLRDFNFNMLLERQPLVIEDNVKDIFTVLNSWFGYNFIQDVEFDNKRIWNINFHKYLYCYTTEDTEILLYKAGNKVNDDIPDNTEPVLAIKLKQNQSIIIPYKWFYNIKNINTMKLYGIHDYVTYLIDAII